MSPRNKSSDEDNESDDGTYMTGSQMPLDPEKEMLKRKHEELLLQVEKYKAAEQKRKKRRSKMSDKGALKRLCHISKDGRLDESSTYLIGKMTRKVLWKTMKYYNEAFKDDCLQGFFKRFGLLEDKEKQDLFADHILFHVDKAVTTVRNNAIYSMKKLVMKDHAGGKYRLNC